MTLQDQHECASRIERAAGPLPQGFSLHDGRVLLRLLCELSAPMTAAQLARSYADRQRCWIGEVETLRVLHELAAVGMVTSETCDDGAARWRPRSL